MADESRNLKLIVAYDGTEFAGFQRQAGGLRTVQAVLEESIWTISGETARLTGAGRTDAGVHARGQVVNFYTAARLSADAWRQALNSVLPEDVLVRSAAVADPEFHARYWAKSKTYSYRIYNDRLRPVFERRYAYHYKHGLEPDLMRQAAALLAGTRDFRSFQAAGSAVRNSVRTVHCCRVETDGPEIVISINADGFLYHMVRNIAGTLIWVGNRRIDAARFQQILDSGDRTQAGPTAPACGLCLQEVFY